ncbi:MAG: hypothetical protein ACW99Q_19150, partial [Candidatus Kariarchaeaceae archaeon]
MKFRFPRTISKGQNDLFLGAKCGIVRLMDNEHPSLSELYKIRYDQYGKLKKNDFQQILSKRLKELIQRLKTYEELNLHIIIPPYEDNYFGICIVVTSLKLYSISKETINENLFSDFDSFALQQRDMFTLHLDEMKKHQIQKLFQLSSTKENNGNLKFNLSVNAIGIPTEIYNECKIELGVHEVELLQQIVDDEVQYLDLPKIQCDDKYGRTVGWDINNHSITIPFPKSIATFGNERSLYQSLLILLNFQLHHCADTSINNSPYNRNRNIEKEITVSINNNFVVLTSNVEDWVLRMKDINKSLFYKRDIKSSLYKIEELGVDLIQLFTENRDILIKIVTVWTDICNTTSNAVYERISVLELFDDAFKTYGSEQLREFQLKMFLKESTFDDLAHPEMHNTVVSKYSPIFGHPFFNFKEKFDGPVGDRGRKLWKKDFFDSGIHIIDISTLTKIEALAIQCFFLILQETRFLDDTWILQSFEDGFRYSDDKIQQVIRDIEFRKSILHFTQVNTIPSFLKSFDLMLFDKEFSTYDVLKNFGASSLIKNKQNAYLFIHEQVDITLLKPMEPQMLDLLYDRNALVKTSSNDIYYTHDSSPAKIVEVSEDQIVEFPPIKVIKELVLESTSDQEVVDGEEFEETEYQEDPYTGPDSLFRIPIMASLNDYKKFNLQQIEHSSNLPYDIVQKYLLSLIQSKWVEAVRDVGDEEDFYSPLSTGKNYIDELISQIPKLGDMELDIINLLQLSNGDSPITTINQDNISEVLIGFRLYYHSLSSFEERKKIIIGLCSVCKYVSDMFIEFSDLLISYYYWSLGLYASFLSTQLQSKREEHLLALKVTEIVKGILDILTEKLQHEFTLKQYDTDSDEIFISEAEEKELDAETNIIDDHRSIDKSNENQISTGGNET